jgi:hypothetical protein
MVSKLEQRKQAEMAAFCLREARYAHGQKENAALSSGEEKDLVPAMLLGRVKDIILKIQIMGDDLPRDLANFMTTTLAELGDISDGTYRAPEASAVLRNTGSRSNYLLLTEHLANVANVFADICDYVRPFVESENQGHDSESINELVKSRALSLVQQACDEILTWQSQGQSLHYR